MRDFLKIMQATGRYIDDHWNKSNFTYTLQTAVSLSFSARTNNRKLEDRAVIFYINECNAVDFETYYQLAIRTKKVIWLDF